VNQETKPDQAKGKMWHGVPREGMEWYPTINEDSCDGCGLCLLTCGNNVFKWSHAENRPVVALKENCVLGCTTCGKLCPENAITFPEDPKAFIKNLVIKYKIYPEVKRELNQRLEKFPDHVVESNGVD